MRVLAITRSLGLNGAALCLYDFLCAIQDTGGRADVLYRGEQPLKQALLERGRMILAVAYSEESPRTSSTRWSWLSFLVSPCRMTSPKKATARKA